MIHPEEDLPIQDLIPLSWRHVSQAFQKGALTHRFLVPDDGAAMRWMGDGHCAWAMLRLDQESLLAINLKQVEQSAGTQQAVPHDALPRALRSHVIKTRKAAAEVVWGHCHQARRSMMLRE